MQTVVEQGKNAPWYETRTPREFPSQTNRVLIIGLDGATFDVLDPLMDAGRMPHLKALIENGAFGILDSTKPPVTPAAWTTFMTGKGPGTHGIIDFERYDVATNLLSFNSTFEIREKTLWEILGEKGLKVGSINVPMTYPPTPVNGFMISGFETPSIKAEFTYPPELKELILREIPGYNYKSRWKRKVFGGEKLFAENLAYIANSFDQGVRLVRLCGEKYGWDALMVLYKLVDNLQHKVWKYVDPEFAGQNPRREEAVARCFEALDVALGQLVEYARSRDAAVVIMSDHGHGRLEGKAQPNLLLKQWGYLALTSAASQFRTRAEYVLGRAFNKKPGGRFAANYGIEHDLAVDWSRTKATVMHAGIYGFLYLNLAGRQPPGIVPPDEYERLREEIQHKLLAATATDRQGNNIRIFPEVYKTEELYKCPRSENEWLPDLLLVPAEGLAVVRKIRGFSPIDWLSTRRLEGTHRIEGILIAAGDNVRKNNRVRANIADVTPTVLAMMGCRVPDDMEGKVLSELFGQPPVIKYESSQPKEATSAAQDIYTDKDREMLTKRLTDLGYLE